jgi:hypothetical protein
LKENAMFHPAIPIPEQKATTSLWPEFLAELTKLLSQMARR